MKIKPFKALRPGDGLAQKIVSVPYDTVNTEEARVLAAGNPCSFLRIVRPEIDLPAGTDVHSDDVYNKAVENFQSFQSDGILVRDGEISFYVYRQVMGGHSQTGVVACCSVADYDNGLIKKHEKTRRDKEDDRARHVKMLNANTGPVFLTYRDNEEIDLLVAGIQKKEPLYDVTAVDGIRHTVWRASLTEGLDGAFEAVSAFYIADGHHRAAAAARAARELAAANPGHTGDEEYSWFLAVLFPAGQLKILPYNRLVHDLNGMTEEDFLAEVKSRFGCVEDVDPVPAAPRKVSMYIGGRWYGLGWEPDAEADPVSALDVSYLQNELLEPLLGIADPRTDERIEFIGGIRGTGELKKLVDSGKGAVAFSMYPCLVEQMIAIADAGQIMPPKSTWFEPKLRSGFFVHTLS